MELSAQRFAVRWSRLTWCVSVAGLIGVVSIMFLLLRVATHVTAGSGLRALLILEGLLPGIIFGVVGLFAPLGYQVNGDAVVVRRLASNVVIRRREVREAWRVGSGEFGAGLRLFGSGGFLGWFGLFYNGSLGRFWAYAGNRQDLVLLTKTDGTKILLSPHPPDAFLEAIGVSGQARN